jgi:hypothetical protein
MKFLSYLCQRFSTQITQRPVFYPDRVAAENDPFVFYYAQFYIPPSIKKVLLMF